MSTITSPRTPAFELWGALRTALQSFRAATATRRQPESLRTGGMSDALLRDIGLGQEFGRPGNDYFINRF